MSYASQLKAFLWEKTDAQLHAPQKKNRMKPCCANAFCRSWELFGATVSPHPLIAALQKHQKTGACPDCDEFFIRSAFLHAGSVADPKKRYHLEIRLPSQKAEQELQEAMENRGFLWKTAQSQRKKVFYLKSSEAMEDFFTVVGAQASALELMQTKVEKDVKNRINRLNNSDSANLQKTVYFAGRVADAIAFLKQHDRFEQLPETLKKTAALRRKYPGASLSELCLYSQERLTKSGLNHRLQKIIEEAEQLEASLKNKEETS